MQNLQLNVFREARRQALHVPLRRLTALWLQKHLVTVPLAEPDHLVLYRRAIPRPSALDVSGVHRRAVQVVQNQRVRLAVGVGQPARYLLALRDIQIKRKVTGVWIAWLL